MTIDAATDLDEFTSAGDVRDYLVRHGNRGRWGPDDQLGTVNLITAEKRLAAAGLVRTGTAVSLSRHLATEPTANNPKPTWHYMEVVPRGDGAGTAMDFFAIACHGTATTHLDALNHVWDDDGLLYNAVAAGTAIGWQGSQWCGLEQLRDGIFTRGVLLDVPRHRGTEYVTQDRPITGRELQDILEASDTELLPGDAVVIHSGRHLYERDLGPYSAVPSARPGLELSCLKFLRQHDVSVLVWDMTDAKPIAFGLPWGVHVAIPAFGLTLLDSALLDRLVQTSEELGRNDFLLTINPLVLRGGTGSPANPVAVF
jgi:kynurenine formamidase